MINLDELFGAFCCRLSIRAQIAHTQIDLNQWWTTGNKQSWVATIKADTLVGAYPCSGSMVSNRIMSFACCTDNSELLWGLKELAYKTTVAVRIPSRVSATETRFAGTAYEPDLTGFPTKYRDSTTITTALADQEQIGWHYRMGMTFQLKSRTKVFILTHVQQAAIQIIWKACNSNALHNSSGGGSSRHSRSGICWD